MAYSAFTQLLSSECLSSGSVQLYVHRDCKDYQGPRVAYSAFTQLLSSECLSSGSVQLYVHRDCKDYHGRGTQDGHHSRLPHSSCAMKERWLISFDSMLLRNHEVCYGRGGHLDFHIVCVL